MEFPIETTDALFVDQLYHACTNPAYIKVGDLTIREGEAGFATYRVELHCVVITYTAKVLERGPDGIPTKYLVISAEYEDC